MSASLVGSEMCIRDRHRAAGGPPRSALADTACCAPSTPRPRCTSNCCRCLLYTSDAADDM
eukprot:6601164-Alexandrium_andersonii.AAC.1